ncbi:MAG: hypothetical protein ACN6O2_01325 [Stenotrophomonas sp.]
MGILQKLAGRSYGLYAVMKIGKAIGCIPWLVTCAVLDVLAGVLLAVAAFACGIAEIPRSLFGLWRRHWESKWWAYSSFSREYWESLYRSKVTALPPENIND